MITQIQPSFKKIRLEIGERLAQIALENPPVNVIDLGMMSDVIVALEYLRTRSDISVIIFSGSGVDFSAGVDIRAHTPEKMSEMLKQFHSVIRSLVSLDKVTIAAVHGNCLGGGAELTLMCDMIFCTEGARFQFPEIQLACFPPVAIVALAAAIGQKRAAEMILTGNVVHGDEAFHIGLANDAVADEEELSELLQEVTQRLTSLSPAALRLAKKAMYASASLGFENGLQCSEEIYRTELVKSDDAREGILAWIEKRKPLWKGK